MSWRARIITRWLMLAVTLVLIVTAMTANAAYTNRVDRENDRVQIENDQEWCDLLTALAKPDPAPATARGREIVDKINELRERKGCLP